MTRVATGRRSTDGGRTLDVFREADAPAFDPVVFDAVALRARGLVTGTAGAGRGAATFFTLDGVPLVLRPCRRGGLVRRLSADRYLSRGAARSRAMREFALLLELEALGLPAPRAHAARRTRHGPLGPLGPLESGALVTARLPGRTLAERLTEPRAAEATGRVPWADIGACIARFHRAGVRHADLNAHNVLVADPPEAPAVSLIDFDRGHRRPAGLPVRHARANLDRLVRSIDKVGAAAGIRPDRAGIEALREAWARELSVR